MHHSLIFVETFHFPSHLCPQFLFPI
uniref:Uncharacterized protein n=1 Tax=Rhizophora mucronata TaxID=61149 RepID=A0A2P2NDK8_RHIMU